MRPRQRVPWETNKTRLARACTRTGAERAGHRECSVHPTLSSSQNKCWAELLIPQPPHPTHLGTVCVSVAGVFTRALLPPDHSCSRLFIETIKSTGIPLKHSQTRVLPMEGNSCSSVPTIYIKTDTQSVRTQTSH